MSNNLLNHSSSWFLSPQHLRKRDSNASPTHEYISANSQTFVSPDEEFYIRKCCPVTLNHLLPDLCLTQKQYVSELGEEFDISLLEKFEKHLEESHKDLSCASSAANKEEEEDGNESDVDDDEGEDYFDNNINMEFENVFPNSNLQNSNKKILKPHKVNYPDSHLREKTSPGTILNNSSSTILNSKTSITKHEFPRRNSKRDDFQNLERIVFPSVKKNQVDILGDNRGRKARRKKKVIEQKDDKYHIKDDVLARVAPRISIDTSLPNSKFQRDFPSYAPKYSQYSPQHLPKPSLCVHHRRSRSLSPFKKLPPFRAKQPTVQEPSSDCHIFPSPHLVELARLRKKELELEEKLILRHRQMLEYERLLPPVDRWYEIKDCRFHQEAHKNNNYLKNEKILPLIHERRMQLLESLSSEHLYNF